MPDTDASRQQCGLWVEIRQGDEGSWVQSSNLRDWNTCGLLVGEHEACHAADDATHVH